MKTKNEDGRFQPKEELNYGFYSKLLKKPFDSVEELQAAEEEYKKIHAAEIRAKEERKAAAEKVKESIIARVKAEEDAIIAKQEAYKAYLEVCDKADKEIKVARQKEAEQLVDFCDKYPEGFHDTITIGDINYRYNYNNNKALNDALNGSNLAESLLQAFNRFIY